MLGRITTASSSCRIQILGGWKVDMLLQTSAQLSASQVGLAAQGLRTTSKIFYRPSSFAVRKTAWLNLTLTRGQLGLEYSLFFIRLTTKGKLKKRKPCEAYL